LAGSLFYAGESLWKGFGWSRFDGSKSSVRRTWRSQSCRCGGVRLDLKRGKRTIVQIKVVADTNTFLAVALDEPERAAILRATRNLQLVAPTILPFEIGNALTAMLKRGALTDNEVIPVWESVQRIPVELRDVDIRCALEIGIANNVYAYDAYFLECSISMRCPLITLDRRLGTVAQDLGISIPEVSAQ